MAGVLASQSGMSSIAPLLGRTLVIVAHPDDECVAFGTLLQRIAHSTVIYCTDGAPFDPYFWKERYGSREKYAELRKQEAREALRSVNVSDIVFLADSADAQNRLADQELFRAIPLAYRLLRNIVIAEKPTALLTLAYEGGHPDHDTCNFLTSQLAADFGIPAYEAPLYHRAGWSGEGINVRGLQRFINDTGDLVNIAPTEAELQRKRAMCEKYPSQGDFLGFFDISREIVRPMALYDYSLPAHTGTLNYEAWDWRMTGGEVCSAFAEFRQRQVQQAI